MTDEPWRPEHGPEDEARRRAALQRLADAARRLGVPRDRLSALLRRLERNEGETRRFLADEVYGVPDELLDDLLRVRLEDLEE